MAAIAPCDVGMMTSKHNIYRGTYSGGLVIATESKTADLEGVDPRDGD